MSPEELAARLCGEGDHHLAQQDLPAATAFYLAAFSCCATTAVQRVNSMDKEFWDQVVATLEVWCKGKGQIPKIQSRNLAVVSLSVGIAAIFLSTLSPNNVVSVECVAVCTKALKGFSADPLREEPVLGLLLERAAAYFFLDGWMQEMIQDLAEAFAANPTQAMRHFEELFSPHDTEKVEEQAKTVLEVKFAAYREAVHARTELRGNHGTELLSPVIQTIQFLLQLCPGCQRELRVRLADCQLLQGHPRAALGICHQLLAAEQKTYHNTLLALRGFCSLHAQDHQQALQDFQKVIEHNSPHPNSCIKALCGRGLIRISGGSSYLAALDYVTACQLKLEETIFTIKSYVPWNQRGLLLKVLQEEGQRMLQKKRDAPGVFQLACLLVELDTADEVSRILHADALYQMGRAEEAHRLLSLALSRNPHRAPVLARLALLQLKKGFVHDGNQLLQRVIRTGDTSCLLPIMDIFKDEDRKLMQTHCHFQALAILKSQQEDVHIKEAIAYLSFAIIAAGGHAGDCLLSRARCYGRLGQMKTAIFDFNAILKEDPRNVQALSGRGFIFLALRQQKEAVQDLISALKVEAGAVIPAILSLKSEAQGLITGWLLQHGRAVLTQLVATKDLSKGETLRDLLTIAKALIQICKAAQYHIFYTDVLIANGRYEEALTHLQGVFGHCPAEDFARARLAVLQLKRRNVAGAAHSFSALAQRDERELEFLLNFVDTKQQQQLAQVAAQEGKVLVKGHQYEKALGYHCLAVVAGRASPRFLRRRATCLQLLGRYQRALGDMDRVIQAHSCHSLRTRVEDLCSKGHLLLALAREEAAVQQYMEALQLDHAVALGSITKCPGTEALTKTFHKIAQHNLEMQRYEEAWKITDCGLKIQKNTELQRLKTRLKREASGCSIH
ncbi:tetratricopeptide repeat protein 34 [Pithys albifrons albifrons]|uniref:tetratricopeptide repeat protein 34 n=1 Tax=Pithys albifrons albifrons TaxID=3385563 RepID=UPI003A5CDFE1